MTRVAKHGLRNRLGRVSRGASILALTAVTLWGGIAPLPMQATDRPTVVRQQGWSGRLYVARVSQANQLVMQLEMLDKPTTSYANAVYTVFVRHQSQWVQVYTGLGARLISNPAGHTTLAPEVIDLQTIQAQLGRDVDLTQLEFKAVATLRYDIRGVARDQSLQFEQVQRYATIATTNTVQIANSNGGLVNSPDDDRPEPSVMPIQQGQSGFSLSVVQNQSRESHVIARISVREKQAQGFLPEKFVGDCRYKLKGKKNKAQFVKGLRAGDRVVVRLFDKKDQLIGYSEFELQTFNSAVSLILPSGSLTSGVVRTVYGIDRNQDFEFDRNTQIFDYFTQVTQVSNYLDTRVSFFSTSQAFDRRLFEVVGLPAPRPKCSYPNSLQVGTLMLANREFWAFSGNLATALISRPGQVVQILDWSSTTTYEVSQLWIQYETVGISQGTLITSSEEYGEYRPGKKRKKQHCNQGIGNGSEGCDPGNSRPHGGSNDGDDDDQGGKKPRHGKK